MPIRYDLYPTSRTACGVRIEATDYPDHYGAVRAARQAAYALAADVLARLPAGTRPCVDVLVSATDQMVDAPTAIAEVWGPRSGGHEIDSAMQAAVESARGGLPVTPAEAGRRWAESVFVRCRTGDAGLLRFTVEGPFLLTLGDALAALLDRGVIPCPPDDDDDPAWDAAEEAAGEALQAGAEWWCRAQIVAREARGDARQLADGLRLLARWGDQ